MSFDIENRKKSHVDVCLKEDVTHKITTGLERYRFVHNALPELSFSDIETETKFLGKTLSMPLIISGMTGGTELSEKINKNIAIAAERCKVAFGVGSQRIAIESKNQVSFEVRKHAKNTVILANLGAVQLNKGFGLSECRKAVKIAGADALVLHLNPLQEVIQQGDTDFRGLKEKIAALVKSIGCPVIIKEVGFGISKPVGSELKKIGVYAIDVSGAGGTDWAKIESKLAQGRYKALGETFSGWGIPTSECIIQSKDLGMKVIAGGGIRTGLDGAKAISLGADYFTAASPFLKAATVSPEKVEEVIEQYRLELKTAMFCTGCKDIEALKHAELRNASL